MIHAELRGKLAERNRDQREDILTSNVFSFFQYADRQVFLYGLLKSWDLQVTAKDAREAEFRYWPQLADGTEPDLVILVGRYYVLVEAKYRSGFGQETATSRDQLTREKEGGADEAGRMDREFRLVAVTAHHLRAQVMDQVPPDVRPALQWSNWQQMALLVRHTLDSGVPLEPETVAFAEDLYELLRSKGLRSYAGLAILEHLTPGMTQVDSLFFDAKSARFRGDFFGFLVSLASESRLVRLPDQIFFGPSGVFFSTLGDQGRTIKQLDSPIYFAARKPLFAALTGADASIRPQIDSIFMGRKS